MPFTEQLKSADPSVIKDALCVLLDESTSPDILAIHKAFNEAEDKHQFLAQFEADESVELDPASEAYAHASERSAQFERWTHYLWLRLELVYLANQKAALNHVMATKEQAKAQGVVIPSLDSIGAAIQAGSEQGISITQSIKIISKI